VPYGAAARPPVTRGGTAAGFRWRTLRRIGVIRTAGTREASRAVAGEGRWMQVAGSWRQGPRILPPCRRFVPETLRALLSSLITHGGLYSLTVRGGSHINLAAAGIGLTPA
jgi:hypothetical protein